MMRPSFTLLFLAMLLLFCVARAYSSLSDETLKAIPAPGDDFNIKTGKLLAPILRPRVPGSPGSTAVLNHFVDFFRTTLPDWQLSFQNSTSKTPATGNSDIPFVNLIASRDPPWTKPGDVGRLTLVAHYDSKLKPEGFIGATDSAAPCAMLLHAARSIDTALTKRWAALQAKAAEKGIKDNRGIQIIFLDGEEAFETWTHEDSLYGARSLAAEWESTPHAAMSTYKNALSSISLFVLLDLLGATNPRVPSYFQTTHWAYRHMATLEKRFRELSLFKSSSNPPSKKPVNTPPTRPTKQRPGSGRKVKKNIPRKPQIRRREDKPFLQDINKSDDNFFMAGMVEDDHIPFMARGVEVLHIIPTPFPRVWHNMDDDGAHLDLDTCSDWAVLVAGFAAEWMDLEGYFETSKSRRGLDTNNMNSKTEL